MPHSKSPRFITRKQARREWQRGHCAIWLMSRIGQIPGTASFRRAWSRRSTPYRLPTMSKEKNFSSHGLAIMRIISLSPARRQPPLSRDIPRVMKPSNMHFWGADCLKVDISLLFISPDDIIKSLRFLLRDYIYVSVNYDNGRNNTYTFLIHYMFATAHFHFLAMLYLPLIF